MKSLPNLLTQLHELVAIPSVSATTPQLDMGNIAVIEKLASWLSDLGFEIEIMPLQNQPHKANLIATLGTGPGGLVLAGHTDTVPYDEHLWDMNPLAVTEENHRLYGLGITDMKGFFPIAIEAAKSVVDKKLQQPLIILATADEESSMAGAQELAAQGKPQARFAVIGEPTGLKPIYAHKGIMMESIHVLGQAGHSSDPAQGNNALEAMNRVINSLLEFRDTLQSRYQNPAFTVATPTINLGCIHGGDNPNRICGSCELHYDIRLLPGMNPDELRNDIINAVNSIARDTNTNIDYQPLIQSVPSFAEELDSEFVKTCEKLTGHSAETANFGTEAGFLQQLGMQTVVLGPGNLDYAHQPNECLSMQNIQPTVDLLTNLIGKYCNPY